MISVKKIYSDSVDSKILEEIIKFCDENSDGDQNYKYNHSAIEQANNSLFYILNVQKRFLKNNGELDLVYDDDQLIAISGFNRSEFHPDIFILGVRTLIHKNYRNNLLLSKIINPYQLEQVEKLGAKCVVWLFDVENKSSLYQFAKKGKLNLYAKNQLDKFSENIYKDLTVLEHEVIVNHSKQNILYRYLDKDFKFQWNLLK